MPLSYKTTSFRRLRDGSSPDNQQLEIYLLWIHHHKPLTPGTRQLRLPRKRAGHHGNASVTAETYSHPRYHGNVLVAVETRLVTMETCSDPCYHGKMLRCSLPGKARSSNPHNGQTPYASVYMWFTKMESLHYS